MMLLITFRLGLISNVPNKVKNTGHCTRQKTGHKIWNIKVVNRGLNTNEQDDNLLWECPKKRDETPNMAQDSPYPANEKSATMYKDTDNVMTNQQAASLQSKTIQGT